MRNFREYRDRITDQEEERLCHSNEDHLDHAYLDDIATTTPGIDSTHMIKRGLSRMGSRHEFPSLGSEVSQYSIKSGYTRDRLVHGRKLSSVLERSKHMDPSLSNIMEHILDSKSEELPLNTTKERITIV